MPTAKISPDGIPLNPHMNVPSAEEGTGNFGLSWKPRVTYRRARRRGKGLDAARYLIRCGDCNAGLLEVWPVDSVTLNINGIHARIADWKQLLLPFLGFEKDKDGRWQDRRS